MILAAIVEPIIVGVALLIIGIVVELTRRMIGRFVDRGDRVVKAVEEDLPSQIEEVRQHVRTVEVATVKNASDLLTHMNNEEAATAEREAREALKEQAQALEREKRQQQLDAQLLHIRTEIADGLRRVHDRVDRLYDKAGETS